MIMDVRDHLSCIIRVKRKVYSTSKGKGEKEETDVRELFPTKSGVPFPLY